MKRSLCLVSVSAILLSQIPTSIAQTPFKAAIQSKYGFASVSCYTCHLRKSDVPADQLEAFKKNGKAFRNSFGKEFDKHLKDKNITKRLADVKGLDSDDPKKVKIVDEVTKEFLDALTKVEAVKSPSGVTYGELLKKAMLDGVK